MNPTLIAAALGGLVAIATIIGFAWRHGQGRVRRTPDGAVISPLLLGIDSLASGVTLLQFSSPLCSPCKSTRVVLGALAEERDGVSHVDIDLADRPELAAQFNIAQTPTTFILDRQGVVRARIGGALRRDAVIAELNNILVAA